MGELEGDQWRRVRMSDKVFYELGLLVQWIGPDEEGFWTPTVWSKPLPERVRRPRPRWWQDLWCFLLDHDHDYFSSPLERRDPHCFRCGRLEHYR